MSKSTETKSVESISLELVALLKRRNDGVLDQAGFDKAYKAITKGVDAETIDKVEFNLTLGKVLDSEAGCFESDRTKDEWLTNADTVLCARFGAAWIAVPTFDPASKAGGTKPKEQQNLNRIRLAVQASRRARLIAKYGQDTEGKPTRGNVDAYWNELKQKHALLQLELATGTTEGAGGGKSGTRNVGRTKDQMFRDALAAWIAECTRTSVKQSDQTLAQRNGMQGAKDLMKVIGDHILASPKK